MYNTSLKNKSADEKTLNFFTEKNKLEELLKLAREMKEKGSTTEEIVAATKLSAEKIEEL
ncbi:hypothetical protein [Pedobacter nyackensis]|uniref:hypothetical protein n=1 Tax=Pedobacter nyackensis TaxID=475255 RepID=UPI0029302860|nr:hypothetical protein [Pedobacter nyackensis]